MIYEILSFGLVKELNRLVPFFNLNSQSLHKDKSILVLCKT